MQLEELSTAIQNSSIGKTSAALRALCFDHQGSWEDAHLTVQDETDLHSAAVHAYLHRKEGDIWNANYWYQKAGRKPFSGTLDAEWSALVREECQRLGIHLEPPSKTSPSQRY